MTMESELRQDATDQGAIKLRMAVGPHVVRIDKRDEGLATHRGVPMHDQRLRPQRQVQVGWPRSKPMR